MLNTTVNYLKYRSYKVLAFFFCSYIVYVFTEAISELLAEWPLIKFGLFSLFFHLFVNRPNYFIDIFNILMKPFAFLRTGETGKVTRTEIKKPHSERDRGVEMTNLQSTTG